MTKSLLAPTSIVQALQAIVFNHNCIPQTYGMNMLALSSLEKLVKSQWTCLALMIVPVSMSAAGALVSYTQEIENPTQGK